MLAVRIHRFGSPEVIMAEEIPVPKPGPDELLVRIHASGVGPWDAWIREGKSALGHSLPLTLGSDLAGTVEAVGSSVKTLAVGTRIFGVANSIFTNAHAQFALVQSDRIAALPERLDFVQGASIPVVAVTAWQMLVDFARVRPGNIIILSGARGSVGGYATQLARSLGVEVIADPPDVTPDLRVDAVLDLVGGESQRRLLPAVKRGGVFVSAVAAAPPRLAAELGVRTKYFLVNVTTERLDRIAEKFAADELVTHVGSVLPLDEARQAHEMLAGIRPRKPGKIVLRCAQE